MNFKLWFLCVSDAIRLVLIYKYGGWYGDIDLVFVNDLSSISNAISGDHLSFDDIRANGLNSVGGMVNNAVYTFDRHHPFIKLCLDSYPSFFDPNERMSGGPILMTMALHKLCGVVGTTSIRRDLFTPERCSGVNVVAQPTFYPFGWFESTEMYSRQETADFWQKVLADSVCVHMYYSQNKHRRVLKQRHYGKSLPFYTYLGENFCPRSFHSTMKF